MKICRCKYKNIHCGTICHKTGMNAHGSQKGTGRKIMVHPHYGVI